MMTRTVSTVTDMKQHWPELIIEETQTFTVTIVERKANMRGISPKRKRRVKLDGGGACYKCGKRGHRRPNCWELDQNSHKRPRNWVSSRNDTGEQSTANCKILVAHVGVDAKNVSNIKKERITARKGSGVRITAQTGSGIGITAQTGSGGGISLLEREAGLGSLLKLVAGSGSLLKR